MKIQIFFGQMSLKAKLIANIVLLAVFMAMVLAVGWFTSVQMDGGFHQVLDGPVVMRDVMRQAHGDILTARSAQRQYLLTRKPEEAKTVRSHIDQAIERLNHLQRLDEQYGHTDDAARNAAIASLLTRYVEAFEGVVKAWQVKGLDDNSGLRGEFSAAIRELIGLLQNFDTAEIRIHLSEVELYQQAYRLKRDEATLTLWRQSLEALHGALQKSEISHFDKDKFRDSIGSYQKNFEQIVQKQKEEGDSEELANAFDHVAEVLAPVMAAVKQYYIRNISLDLGVLRRHERDYLLLGEPRYVQRFNNAAKKMLENVAKASSVPEKMRGDVSRFLEKYQQNFMQLVEQDQEITRLREVMRQAIQDIQPILEEHIQAAEGDALTAEKEIDSRSRALLVMMIAVGLLATLLAGFFNLLLGRGIRHQVGDEPSVLEEDAIQVAAGDLTVDLTGGSGIRRAMGGMVQSLRSFAKHGALQSETISAVVGQLLLSKEALIADIHTLVEKTGQALAGNRSLDEEVSRLRSDLNQVSENTQETSAATDELSSEFSAISTRVVRAGSNLNTVANSSRQANNSLEEMRQAMVEAGDSISTVASAVEEMTANLAGVRNRCEEASDEALQAQNDAKATSDVMERLRRTAREIGKVVDVIKSIAEQTNLLALNASIEAAGAGELGRGFAVVASEVKELADQTRKATETIRRQVEGIRTNTSEATEATDRVFQSIGNLAQTNEEILNAVSDQTQALDEISRSVAMVSRQTGEVVELVNQTTTDLAEVDRRIQEIANGVNEVGRNVQDGVTTARHVARQASDTRERSQRMMQQADRMVEAAGSVNKAALEAKERVHYLQGTTVQIGQLVEVVSVVSHDLGEVQQHFKVGAARFDIQGLKSAHLAWMMELQQFAHGRLETINTMAEENCDICRVLKEELLVRFTEEPAVAEIVSGHGQLHQLAAAVVACKTSGGTVEEDIAAFNQQRMALFNVLDRVYLD